jgi:hypothetical protein
MSPGGVPAKGGRRRPDISIVLRPLAAKATEALADPVVRQRILEQGQVAAGAFQRWRDERTARGGDGGGDGGSALRVVHRRLERRERRLREVVAALSADDPLLGARLGPVVAELDGVAKALAVADAMPLRSRRAAHHAIDDVLDRLERGLLEASLGLVDPG